jgi:hypothetical protein
VCGVCDMLTTRCIPNVLLPGVRTPSMQCSVSISRRKCRLFRSKRLMTTSRRASSASGPILASRQKCVHVQTLARQNMSLSNIASMCSNGAISASVSTGLISIPLTPVSHIHYSAASSITAPTVPASASASASASAASASNESLELRVSNPAMLLNDIAHRYESTARIVMEYVDNPIDDAEEEFRDNNASYPHPVDVEITIGAHSRKSARFIQIRDNCRGLERDKLLGLVRKIGDSSKKAVPWLNGQFGFGVSVLP